jgi:hypothetical protein
MDSMVAWFLCGNAAVQLRQHDVITLTVITGSFTH